MAHEGILLDTVTFLDFLSGNVPGTVRRTIVETENRFLSVITPWEIALKRQLRERIQPADIATGVSDMGLRLKSVLIDHIWSLTHLPQFEEHRDPFDRLLIAQAYTHKLLLITTDRRFSLYPHLKLLTY